MYYSHRLIVYEININNCPTLVVDYQKHPKSNDHRLVVYDACVRFNTLD